MHQISRFILFFSLSFGVTFGQSLPVKAFAALRQGFEPNRGQADPTVEFTSHGPGYALSLAGGSADLRLVSSATPPNSAALRFRLGGPTRGARVEAFDRQPGKSNYFLGNDSRFWLTDVPQYGRVEYHG